MAAVRSNLAHEDRTVAEPRQGDIHSVVLSKIERVNNDIKLFKLSIQDKEKGVKFIPGQWLDVMIPGLPKVGGFTLTSTPAEASPSFKNPYLELAVQRSENPPAKWLWKSPENILNASLRVRVGGSFTYPPLDIEEKEIKKLVFVAGGVGINPLMSMLSHLSSTSALPPKVEFLYSVKMGPTRENHQGNDSAKFLFYDRLQKIALSDPDRVNVELFITGMEDVGETRNGSGEIIERESKREVERWKNEKGGDSFQFEKFHKGRIIQDDLLKAIGSKDKAVLKKTVCLVCGPPKMTDKIVALLERYGARVYCEKWW